MTRFILACAITLLLSAAARAQEVTDYNIFEEDFMTQTGPSTTTSDAWAFTANLSTQYSTDISTATLTTPTGTFLLTDTSAPGASPTNYAYRDSAPTQTDLEQAYPLSGTYVFSTGGGTLPSDSGSITVPSDLTYPSSIPLFTNLMAFQNANAAAATTFDFPGYTALTGDNQYSYEYFSVVDAATGTTIFSDDGLASGTTSVTLPGGTLDPGTDYYAVIDYSNREYLPDDTGFLYTNDSGVTPFVGLDYNTTVDFSTAAVPEPATAPMLLAGVGLLVLGRRFLRRA